MAASGGASALALALVAGGFTTFGVVVKISYDAWATRRASKSESVDRFATERREAYETFYSLVQQQRKRENAMRNMLIARGQGKTEVSDAEAAAFPPTVLGELITASDQVRRLARNYSVITAAEAIVQLFIDMTKAGRAALEDLASDDEITWFLLQRFIEDRIDEFVHGYREDLGLGRPAGAPKSWPMVKREHPVSLAESEAVLRAHIPIKIMPKDAAEHDRDALL
jgi:hypothetical protein